MLQKQISNLEQELLEKQRALTQLRAIEYLQLIATSGTVQHPLKSHGDVMWLLERGWLNQGDSYYVTEAGREILDYWFSTPIDADVS